MRIGSHGGVGGGVGGRGGRVCVCCIRLSRRQSTIVLGAECCDGFEGPQCWWGTTVKSDVRPTQRRMDTQRDEMVVCQATAAVYRYP